MIEPIWAYLKREIMKGGPINTKEEAIERWEKAWASMRQKMLQSRVRRIRRHLIEIVRHEGENEYLEGSHRYHAKTKPPFTFP
jgi:aspartate aminotransferase-like enzyme